MRRQEKGVFKVIVTFVTDNFLAFIHSRHKCDSYMSTFGATVMFVTDNIALISAPAAQMRQVRQQSFFIKAAQIDITRITSITKSQ